MIVTSRHARLAALLASALPVAACATHDIPKIAYDEPAAANLTPEPARPVVPIAIPEPLPLPGQLKKVGASKAKAELPDPAARIIEANETARVQPVRNGFINAVQVYPYAPGALYQVYAAPGHVTTIMLQEGEGLIGPGPVAAGDTVRWIIGDTESGAGAAKRVHVMVKPTRPDLETNLIINTDRRTYLLELRANETAYMASVSWRYPLDDLTAIKRQGAEAERAAPVAASLDVDKLQFRYVIEGDDPPWKPRMAFDDGRQVFIAFPPGIGQGEMPPLFVTGAEGGELVNYRVRQNYIIVDRLFAAAELRLGKDQEVVRIVRTDGRRS